MRSFKSVECGVWSVECGVSERFALEYRTLALVMGGVASYLGTICIRACAGGAPSVSYADSSLGEGAKKCLPVS